MRCRSRIRGRAVVAALAATGLVLLAALAISEHAGASDAARRVPRGTHIGVATSDFVVLRLVDEESSPRFVRLASNGTLGTSEFVVPSGQALVVTGLDSVGEFKDTNTQTVVRFWIESADGATRNIVATQRLDTPQTLNSSNGKGYTGGATQTYTTGFVLGAGTKLRIDAANAVTSDVAYSTAAFWNSTTPHDFDVTVRGYLTAAE